ncbi:unnamed protein product [Ectocarpus sp. 12 AP-2014]
MSKPRVETTRFFSLSMTSTVKVQIHSVTINIQAFKRTLPLYFLLYMWISSIRLLVSRYLSPGTMEASSFFFFSSSSFRYLHRSMFYFACSSDCKG